MCSIVLRSAVTFLSRPTRMGRSTFIPNSRQNERGYLRHERSLDLAPCVRPDIWRGPGWGGRSALVVGPSPACGLQGRCENDNGPDWHVSGTCAGSLDRVRED